MQVTAKVTREYFAAYDAISLLLDEHPETVTRVHRDLRKPLTMEMSGFGLALS